MQYKVFILPYTLLTVIVDFQLDSALNVPPITLGVNSLTSLNHTSAPLIVQFEAIFQPITPPVLSKTVCGSVLMSDSVSSMLVIVALDY